MAPGDQRTWGVRILFLAFLVSLFAVPELMRLARPSARASIPEIDCYAAAVALRQHLFDARQADPALPADYASDLEERFDTMRDLTQRLRRRDDPRAHAMRPIIARAETARDDAVARDAQAYRQAAWTEVQRCHDQYFRGAA